jgi:hypothetical protein
MIASAVPCGWADLRAFYAGSQALLPRATGRVCRRLEDRARRGDTAGNRNSSEYKAKTRVPEGGPGLATTSGGNIRVNPWRLLQPML